MVLYVVEVLVVVLEELVVVEVPLTGCVGTTTSPTCAEAIALPTNTVKPRPLAASNFKIRDDIDIEFTLISIKLGSCYIQ